MYWGHDEQVLTTGQARSAGIDLACLQKLGNVRGWQWNPDKNRYERKQPGGRIRWKEQRTPEQNRADNAKRRTAGRKPRPPSPEAKANSGQFIRALLRFAEQANLTRSSLAKIIGVSDTAISQWIAGKSVPSIEKQTLILAGLGIMPDVKITVYKSATVEVSVSASGLHFMGQVFTGNDKLPSGLTVRDFAGMWFEQSDPGAGRWMNRTDPFAMRFMGELRKE